MNTALRAEFLKLRTTKTAAGLAGLAVAVTVLMATLEAATAGTGRGMAIPSLATPAGLRDALASTGFALIAAAVLGTVITAGEFRHKTATGTYLDQPDRSRVLAAKAAAAAAAGALTGLAAAATATGIGLGFAAAADTRSPSPQPPSPGTAPGPSSVPGCWPPPARAQGH